MSDIIRLLNGRKMKFEEGKLYMYFPPEEIYFPSEEPKAWYDKYGVLHAAPMSYDNVCREVDKHDRYKILAENNNYD